MLKDLQSQHQIPRINDLRISENFEVEVILSFIDRYIINFPEYYFSIKDSERENRISDILVHHFQLCKNEQSGGFFPFDFRKNPSQPNSDKETDIGVFVLTRNRKPLPIIEFEAKRFSESSNNKEYVCGERGGIERFKRGYHSSHLNVCGMFGYVQSRNPLDWIIKINDWIKELSENNADPTIYWTGKEEGLTSIRSFSKVERLHSSHYRKISDNNIELWHYLIDLSTGVVNLNTQS